MSKNILILLIVQFLSAFADNAILFTVIAIVLQTSATASWYIPALQSVFLIAFVLLAPWVGAIADRYPKPNILIIANLIKASGAFLLLLAIEPIIAYGIIGIGAALYSPAKYGILPEYSQQQALLKANSWVEGSTILAVLSGMVIGARIADQSIDYALITVLILFLTSAAITLLLPKQNPSPPTLTTGISVFITQLKGFFTHPLCRFALINAAIFWATAATLRVILIAWAPLTLQLTNASEIAELTFFLAIGIILGSSLVPRLIPFEKLRRVLIPAYFMGVLIIILSLITQLIPARITLMLIGFMGGLYIVPINTALQALGHQSIGSGRAVALQGFSQNIAMLCAIGLYTLSTSYSFHPNHAIIILGCNILLCATLAFLYLPKNLALTPADKHYNNT